MVRERGTSIANWWLLSGPMVWYQGQRKPAKSDHKKLKLRRWVSCDQLMTMPGMWATQACASEGAKLIPNWRRLEDIWPCLWFRSHFAIASAYDLWKKSTKLLQHHYYYKLIYVQILQSNFHPDSPPEIACLASMSVGSSSITSKNSIHLWCRNVEHGDRFTSVEDFAIARGRIRY